MAFTDLPPIALVQMEVIPGRPERNVARMVDFIDDARKAGAEVVVFSEMCIPGYLMGDTWELDTLVEDFAAYSDDIRAASRGMTVIFGNVVIDKDAIGEDGRARKYNAVHVCHDGQAVRARRCSGWPAGGGPPQDAASQLPLLRRRPALLLPAQARGKHRPVRVRLDGALRSPPPGRRQLPLRRATL